MAKRKPAVQPQQTHDDPATEVDEDREERREEPALFAGLEMGGGAVEYVRIEEDRPRRLSYNGANWEHVSEDADGIWIYRRM